MKRLWIIFLLCAAWLQAQTVQKGVLIKKDGSEIKVENLIIDSYANQVTYVPAGKQVKTVSFEDIDVLKQKKGSYWLTGMLGGLGGSLLVSAVTAPEDGEWWHGAGPVILAGTGIGALVGTLIPKYKEVSFRENTTLSFSGTGFKLSF
ncbi:hypothetical protein GO491_05115 [Flavobacteriaceae bacterium Ap0902]|nr:hypothetical protein [Flavobacteriaceae bacterium Ap0902]